MAENVVASLDISIILDKLDEGFCFTRSSEDQDLVLVVGCSGVGKSTTCNYLVGHPMRRRFHEGLTVVETVDETDITIGHEISAETLYAKGIMAADPCFAGRRVCLVDCPGFLGNRTIEECVVESISTELAIRSGRQVKGVLVLLSLLTLLETRMLEIHKLIQTLIGLFKNPLEMVNHSVFVVTKNMNMSAEEGLAVTLARLGALEKHAQKEALKLQDSRGLHSSSDLTIGDFDKIAGLCSAVLRNAASVVVVDPLDNGESKTRIFQQINHIQPRKGYIKKMGSAVKKAVGFESTDGDRPITIDDFNFSDYNSHRVTFNKAVFYRVGEGSSLIKKIKSTSERFLNINLELSDSERRVAQLHELRSNLEEEMTRAREGQTQLPNVNYKSVETFEIMLKENEASRVAKEEEIEDGKRKRKRLENELGELDVNDRKLFRRDDIDVSVPWWKFLGWEEKEFEFNTYDESVPIIHKELSKVNGKWSDEKDRCKAGFYAIKYTSDFMADPAFAKVEVYIRKKDDAGVRVQIAQIRDELEALDAAASKKISELEKLDGEGQALRSSIELRKDNEEGYKRSLEQRLKECESNVSRYMLEIQQLLTEREESRPLQLKLLQEFADNRPKLDMIVAIDRLLVFPSTLVRKFVSDFEAFVSRLDYYASISDDAADQTSLPQGRAPPEESESGLLKDPLTGGAIKDLVFTPRGTAFDEISLLGKFDKSVANPPPFRYERGDGTIEEIKFLEWTKVTDVQNYLEKLRSDNLVRSQGSSSHQAAPSFVIDGEDPALLRGHWEELRQEVERMREEIEAKETEMERIAHVLKKTSGLP